MKQLISCIKIVIFLSTFTAFAQEKSELNMGTGFGVPFYSFKNSGSNLLTPQNSGMWGISLYVQKQIKNTWLFESNVVTHRINTGLQLNDPQFAKRSYIGYPQVINNFQFNHLLLKKMDLGMSRFSFIGGAGAGLNYINVSSMSFRENGFDYIRTRDEFGQNSPLYDISVVNGERIVNSTIQLHLLAKFGVSYQLRPSSSLVIFSHHGYNLAAPTIENKLPEIRFENESLSAHQKLRPFFSFVSLGYEIKIR